MVQIALKILLGCNPGQQLPGCNLKLAPILRGREKPKKKADPSRLVDGRFNKQRNGNSLSA